MGLADWRTFGWNPSGGRPRFRRENRFRFFPMLQCLRIHNLALLEEVFLEFEPGFTAVTGETGAGKSILLGALRLLSGGRADKSVIRQGADSCEVEAGLFFANPRETDALLEELGLPPCEEGSLLLRRVVHREKMAKVFVNGSLTTLASLQTIGDRWIDFHGPEDPQRLFQPAFQLELLDLHGGHGPLLAEYRERFGAWRETLAKREELATAGRLSPEETAFYQNQIDRIDECGVSEESIRELETRFHLVNGAKEAVEAARALAEGLNGDNGVFAKLGSLQRTAGELAEADPAAEPLRERLTSLAIEAEDLGREFERAADGYDIEPEEAERITTRMNLWLDLKRRLGGEVETVLAKRAELAERLEQQGDLAGALRRLEAEVAAREKAVRETASALLKKREAAASDLSGKAAAAIQTLGFRQTVFQIKVHPETKPTAQGGSACEFLFSPNAGQAPMPLQKIASSGEIARVMLALKTVLAAVDRTPVLVFDEVDANVGGEIGRVVGARMADLGRAHQVFCVTHLPQVASLAAGGHFVVEKEQETEKTRIAIRSLHGDRAGRVEELARMLGDRKGKSALAHAGELLGSESRPAAPRKRK